MPINALNMTAIDSFTFIPPTDLFCTVQKTHSFSVTETNQLITYTAKVAVCSKIHEYTPQAEHTIF